MSPSPWNRLLRLLGLKSIEDRIDSVDQEAVYEEQEMQREFYYSKDLFAQAQEDLQYQEDAFSIGTHDAPHCDPLTVKISPKDFKCHKYIIGTTGTGKTYFIENLLIQHISRGDGAGVIDIHGDLFERLCGWIAAHASNLSDPEEFLRKKIVILDLTDDYLIPGINPLQATEGISSDRLVNQLILIFRRFYKDLWGVKIEELARFGFLALSEAGLTLLDLEDLFINEAFRSQVLGKVKTQAVIKYFTQQFQNDTQYVSSILNKMRPLLLDQKLQLVLGQKQSSIKFREIIDQGKILLVNLNKSYLSANADLIASMLMGWIQNAALSRRNVPENRRTPFFLYVDEFQNFANEQFEEILTETRKYGVYLTMAHQSLSQLDPRLRHIALGNTDIHCFFRIEAGDCEQLSRGIFESRGGLLKEPVTPYDSPEHLSDREELSIYQRSMSGIENRYFYFYHKGKPYKSRLVRSLDVESPDADGTIFDYVKLSKESYTKSARIVQEALRENEKVEMLSSEPRKPKQRRGGKKPPPEDIVPDIADFKE